MDFQSLSRKELQALCKKNKIPANLTNLAMADSLANLSIVEGLEEIGNAQSALQSPQTCRGSSRRPLKDSAALVDDEPEPPNNSSVTLTRTRRGTRTRNDQEENDSCQNASGLETLKTPAVRTSSRRAVASSVCKRLDSQVKDKDTSAAPRPYSTRRSARLVTETIVSESGPRNSRGTKAIHISALTDNDFSKEETKAASVDDSSVSDCTSPNAETDTVEVSAAVSSLTVNDSFTMDKTIVAEIGDSATSDFKSISSDAENPVLPSAEYATEEKSNALSEEAVVENQVSNNASAYKDVSDAEASSELLVDIKPQKAPAVDNSTPEDSTDLVEGEDTTADDKSLLLASATEAKSNDVCVESAIEIQVTSGAISSQVLVDIKSPKGLAVDYSTFEDSNNLTPNVDIETVVSVSAEASNCEAASKIFVDIKSPRALTVDNSIAEDSDNLKDSIHVEDDYKKVNSVSAEVPSNGAEKTCHIEDEELVGNVVSGETTKVEAAEALITGDTNQTVPPVDHASNSFTHQTVTGVDVASTDQKADAAYLLSEDGLETVVSVSAESSGCGGASNGQVFSEVLVEIKSPKALTVDNSIGEVKDDIHAKDDSQTVISISAEFPSNVAEKTNDMEDEELVVNGNNVVSGETSRADAVQVLTAGDGYSANQITSPIDNAPNSCTHQAATGKDVPSTDQVLVLGGFDCVAADLEYSPVGKVNPLESIGSHPCANACDELLEGENATQVVESMSGASPKAVTASIVNQVPTRQSEATPKSSNKKKATQVPKMVLKVLEEEDKDIVQVTEEKEKAAPITKMVTSLIDDNKENGMLVAEEERNNRKVENNAQEALQKATSLRKLRKLVKEMIQSEKARPALQSLTDNRLDGN